MRRPVEAAILPGARSRSWPGLRADHETSRHRWIRRQTLQVSRFKIAGVLVGLAGLVTVVACGTGTSGTSTGLASSQVLHFPVLQDPKTWDPGRIDAEVDSELTQNVYDNLWRFDNNLNLVPDIASDVPSTSNGGISADGLTYTVHLKHNVTFNNGDALTAKDVLYSWNRAADLRG